MTRSNHVWGGGVPKGWIPIGIGTEIEHHVVRWMHLPIDRLKDPFFGWAIDQARACEDNAIETETDIRVVAETSALLSSVTPAGIIFYVSRCGSTLLLNAMKSALDVLVLSEAQPITRALRLAATPSDYWAEQGRDLVCSLIKIFAHAAGETPRRVVFKGVVDDIRHFAVVRSMWPQVPCVIMIRDPVEVIVSNVEKPSEWLTRWQTKSIASRKCPFGPPPPELLNSGIGNLLAWITGRFYFEAVTVMDEKCTVLDYEDLTPVVIRSVMSRFGLELDPHREHIFHQTLQLYSKSSGVPYQSDIEAKRRRTTPEIRAAADKWAVDDYRRLRDSSRRLAFE